ncbi:hypothetical protein Adt_41848 [Abeliophyllum distichum]|uniref:Uncharacterized protein n=1 Tax=Abeliophyllum distichum TaxID=126358 RepID=A0ABD1PQV7_9LAMI
MAKSGNQNWSAKEGRTWDICGLKTLCKIGSKTGHFLLIFAGGNDLILVVGENWLTNDGKWGERKWEVVEQLDDYGGYWFWLKSRRNIHTTRAFSFSDLGEKSDLMVG